MRHRNAIVAIAIITGLGMTGARAQEMSKYPDWSGQWLRIGGIQWDPGKPLGARQQPPLTPDYQALPTSPRADRATMPDSPASRMACRGP
jgi:hypothetical protein